VSGAIIIIIDLLVCGTFCSLKYNKVKVKSKPKCQQVVNNVQTQSRLSRPTQSRLSLDLSRLVWNEIWFTFIWWNLHSLVLWHVNKNHASLHKTWAYQSRLTHQQKCVCNSGQSETCTIFTAFYQHEISESDHKLLILPVRPRSSRYSLVPPCSPLQTDVIHVPNEQLRLRCINSLQTFIM